MVKTKLHKKQGQTVFFPTAPEHYFSPEILSSILLRLPADVLIKFKLVSKLWFSVISDPHFIRAHLHRIRNYEPKTRARIALCSCGRFCDDFHVIGSADGLVCVLCPRLNDVYVLNPITGEAIKLAKPYNRRPECHLLFWGFGYDSGVDDYKVLLGFTKNGWETNFQVLKVKSNMWTSVGDVSDYALVNRPVGILCNGALHWVALKNMCSAVILAFDLHEEKFVEIPQPEDQKYNSRFSWYLDIRLGVFRGRLAIFKKPVGVVSSITDLWLMERYASPEDVGSTWIDVDINNIANDDIKSCEAMFLSPPSPHHPRDWNPLCSYGFLPPNQIVATPIYIKTLISPNVVLMK